MEIQAAVYLRGNHLVPVCRNTNTHVVGALISKAPESGADTWRSSAWGILLQCDDKQHQKEELEENSCNSRYAPDEKA